MRNDGFSLVEVVLAISIFALIVTAIAGSVFYAQQNTAFSGVKSRAIVLAEEGLESVRNIKDNAFSNLATNGTYYLTLSGAPQELDLTTTGPDQLIPGSLSSIFSRQITIEDGPNSYTKKVTSTINWNYPRRSGSIALVSYLTDWERAGIVLPTWANPGFDVALDVNHPGGTATTNAYDAYKIQVDGNYAYIIKYDGASATYNDFFVIDISGASPSVVGYTRVYTGTTALTLSNISNVVTSGSNTYIYVTTNNDTYEFARINVTNPAAPAATPYNISAGKYTVNRGIYVMAGSPPTVFIVAGTSNASTLFAINGDTGATIKSRGLTAGNNQTAEEVVVIGNTAYVSSDNNTNELQVIDNADGTATAMGSVGSYNILTDSGGTSSANALSIDGFGNGAVNTVLLGLTDGRLIKVNHTLSPTNIALGGSYNSAVTSNFNDISINSANTLAFIATSNTAAEFRVVTMSSMTSFGFHDISGTTAIGRGIAYHDTKDKAYMATQDDTRELYIVKPQP